MIHEGIVHKWICRGGQAASGYGFIEESVGWKRPPHYYFSAEGIVPDALGRTMHARIEGNLVRFRTEPHTWKGKDGFRAIDITPEFPPDDIPEDLDAYREVSRIGNIVSFRRRVLIFLERPSGDYAMLVNEDFDGAFSQLRIGDQIEHGIDVPARLKDRSWRATNAFLAGVNA
jgi:hypothetical protein